MHTFAVIIRECVTAVQHQSKHWYTVRILINMTIDFVSLKNRVI
jgi:hypothetical protein